MIVNIDNGCISAAINTRGGELISLKSTEGYEYIWQGDPKYWEGHSPVLFPVCGRLTGLKYTYGGNEYPMPPHGFLQNFDLELLGGGIKSLVLGLSSSEETKKYWPFDFKLRLCFELAGSMLKVSAEVKNLSGEIMPFSFGGHPGFNVPMDEGLDFEDYYVKLDDGVKPEEIEITPDGYVGPQTFDFPLEKGCLPLKHGLFAVEGRFLRNAGHSAVLKSDKGNRCVEVNFPFANVLGLWHEAGTDAPFLCIEPWAGSPDKQGVPCSLTEKADMLSVKPGDTNVCTYTITVK